MSIMNFFGFLVGFKNDLCIINGWVMFDWVNLVFVLVIIVVVFLLYFLGVVDDVV